MKNLIATLIVSTISFSAFAQKTNNDLTFCNNKNEISLKELISCKKLTHVNPSIKVNSFTIGYTINENYKEFRCNGNALSEKAIEALTKDNPNLISIEKIEIENKKSDKKTLSGIKFKVR